MCRTRRWAALAALLVLPLVAVRARAGGDQDLSDAAAKEKQRRAGKRGRTFTEDDLARVHWRAPAQPATPVAPATRAPAAAPSLPDPDDLDAVADAEDGDRELRAAVWSATLREAQAEAGLLSKEVEQLRGELSDTRGGLYGATRTNKTERLDQLSHQLGVAQERVGILEEGARRKGYRQ
jgi:hypothetical protein